MREKVCCILSSDEAFAIKLADYINNRHLLPLQVLVYTRKEPLIESVNNYDTEILIVDGDNDDNWYENISDTVIFLNNGYEDTADSIAKYQSADKLTKKIMSYMTGFENHKVGGKKTVLGCIYSPASKCFKTTLALGMGLWSAKMGRSLFINLEQFAGLNNILSDSSGGLSQALYYYKSQHVQGLGKILSSTDSLMGMDYFYPVTNGEDIAELDNREFIDFINLLVDKEIYNYIWIDVGNVYGNPWRLMEVCDRVYLPNPLDYIGRRKVSQMENYLVASGRGELISRFIKVDIPFNEAIAGYDITPEILLASDFGEIVNRLLREV